jgi:hypothetical protein
MHSKVSGDSSSYSAALDVIKRNKEFFLKRRLLKMHSKVSGDSSSYSAALDVKKIANRPFSKPGKYSFLRLALLETKSKRQILSMRGFLRSRCLEYNLFISPFKLPLFYIKNR